jgi:hypothetical protein
MVSSSARSTTTGDRSDNAVDVDVSVDVDVDMTVATDNTPNPIPPVDDQDNDNDSNSESNSSNRDPTELPFLVTHWLSTFYHPPPGGCQKNAGAGAAAAAADTTNVEQKEAMDKIRRAAADLASAFSTLGAFGTASRVSIVGVDVDVNFDVCVWGGWRCTRTYIYIGVHCVQC